VNKPELIAAISTESGLTQTDSEKALNAFINIVTKTLASKEKVQLVGFGSFEPVLKAEHQGINPRTKETITVPSKTVPKFYPGSKLRDAVEG
jgi:DNA-binding protein HU-beta